MQAYRSAIFLQKTQSLSSSLCLTAYKMDGKDSGVKVVSGVNKGENILSGNQWACKGVGVVIHQMLPFPSSSPPHKKPRVGTEEHLSGEAFGSSPSGTRARLRLHVSQSVSSEQLWWSITRNKTFPETTAKKERKFIQPLVQEGTKCRRFILSLQFQIKPSV